MFSFDVFIFAFIIHDETYKEYIAMETYIFID